MVLYGISYIFILISIFFILDTCLIAHPVYLSQEVPQHLRLQKLNLTVCLFNYLIKYKHFEEHCICRKIPVRFGRNGSCIHWLKRETQKKNLPILSTCYAIM